MTTPYILQLVSPALPVGAFSYSEGLEFLTQATKLSNEEEIYCWLKDELLRGQLRIEAASLSPIMDCLKIWKANKASSAKQNIEEWDSWLIALRDSVEIRSQQRQMGRSLLQLLSELNYPLPDKSKDFSWPIAWSWASLSWELPKFEVIQGYLFSWIANQLSACLRLLPLGPNKAQKIQLKLLPIISSQAKLLQMKDPHEIWSGDIGATMAQQSHSQLYSKLFRS